MRTESRKLANERPQKENICAVIVSHHPDPDFQDGAKLIARQVGRIVVVDNCSNGNELALLYSQCRQQNMMLLQNERNLGIAAALNQGSGLAADHGYEWVLALDQDTVVAEDMVETLSAVYEEYPEKEKLAIIGSNYRDSNSGRLLFSAELENRCSWEEVKTAITSGSLVSLAAYSVLGRFRDEFFMDFVDMEYCLRARSRGFKIILARKPVMEHSIGATTMHKLRWKTTGTSNHAAIRRYYMTRNHLVLVREYLQREPMWALSTLYSRLKSTILMCLFEENRPRKLGYTAMGVIDGLSSNFHRNPL